MQTMDIYLCILEFYSCMYGNLEVPSNFDLAYN
jgi:hypothetical protein